MEWLKNIENIINTGKVGTCPVCKSENTDYNAKKVVDDWGYMVVWCNDCKHHHVVSRMKVDSSYKTNQNIPENLI